MRSPNGTRAPRVAPPRIPVPVGDRTRNGFRPAYDAQQLARIMARVPAGDTFAHRLAAAAAANA